MMTMASTTTTTVYEDAHLVHRDFWLDGIFGVAEALCSGHLYKLEELLGVGGAAKIYACSRVTRSGPDPLGRTAFVMDPPRVDITYVAKVATESSAAQRERDFYETVRRMTVRGTLTLAFPVGYYASAMLDGSRSVIAMERFDRDLRTHLAQARSDAKARRGVLAAPSGKADRADADRMIADVRYAATRVLAALRVCHDLGFAHGDVKAANVLITYDPSFPGSLRHARVALADFGLSRRFANVDWGRSGANASYLLGPHVRYEETRRTYGTAAYMSVDAHRGVRSSRRSDIESFGWSCIEWFGDGSELPWTPPRRTDTRPRDPSGRTDTRPRDPSGRTDNRGEADRSATDTRPRDPFGLRPQRHSRSGRTPSAASKTAILVAKLRTISAIDAITSDLKVRIGPQASAAKPIGATTARTPDRPSGLGGKADRPSGLHAPDRAAQLRGADATFSSSSSSSSSYAFALLEACGYVARSDAYYFALALLALTTDVSVTMNGLVGAEASYDAIPAYDKLTHLLSVAWSWWCYPRAAVVRVSARGEGDASPDDSLVGVVAPQSTTNATI
jgi:serine/threonine protein kinase